MQKQAQDRFAAHIENPKEGKALPSEYAVPVYKIVLKAGGQQEFDQVCYGICRDRCRREATMTDVNSNRKLMR